MRVAILGLLLVACAEPVHSPATAPTATASLEVPPLPPPKPTSEKPVVRQAPPPAGANDDDDESPLPRDVAGAEAAFQEALQAMKADNHPKARALFLKSLRLDRAVGTLLNLALCEEKMGERGSAMRHYQATIDEATKKGMHERAAIARERLAGLMAGP